MFSGTRAERGEHAGLRLDSRGCHLFSAGPDEPARPSSAGAGHIVNDAGLALNEAGQALNRALDGACHVLDGAAHVRDWPCRLVTVSHLGSDHA